MHASLAQGPQIKRAFNNVLHQPPSSPAPSGNLSAIRPRTLLLCPYLAFRGRGREVLEGGRGGEGGLKGGGGFGWDPHPPGVSNPESENIALLQSTPAYLWMDREYAIQCKRQHSP